MFRGKVLELEKRIWNGIYKQTWGEQTAVSHWCKLCEDSIWRLTREIIEYKKMNAIIQTHLSDIRSLQFVKLDDLSNEYDPDKFCKSQYSQIQSQADLIRTRCGSVLAQVKKIRTLVGINVAQEDNLQWSNYRLAIANKVADSVVDGLAHSLKFLATLLHQPQNKPIIKLVKLAINIYCSKAER